MLLNDFLLCHKQSSLGNEVSTFDEIMTLFLNTLNILFLYNYIRFLLKKRIDSVIIWYILVSLYFINIPLLVDSIMMTFSDPYRWELLLMENNKFYEFGFMKHLYDVSFYSLIFNTVLITTYHVVTPLHKKHFQFPAFDNNERIVFLPWWLYFLIAYGGFALFMYHNNIHSFMPMEAATWNANRGSSVILNLLVMMLVPLFSASILRTLYEHRYVLGCFLLIPVLLVGIITGARALIIASVFYFIYYYLWKNANRLNLKKIIILTGFCALSSILMTSFRGGWGAAYPIARDWCFSDLFYSYIHADYITTKGEALLRLIVTGFYNFKSEDLTVTLADYKFGTGWGSLHPSILGWAYIDLKSLCWLAALYFGFFLGLCDRLRHSLPLGINLLFLAYLFTFIAVGVRGSVYSAYAGTIYPVIILTIYCFYRKKRYEDHSHS